jgi:3'(2'), 5'-bisphosphate nucleotidase
VDYKARAHNLTELPFSDPLSEAHLAVEAAEKASRAVMEVYVDDFVFEKKEDDSPITKADLESNRIIRNMLEPLGLPILSEEDADDITRLEHNRIWIVDPLDGTSDFVNRTGEFTIMIALVQDKVPVMGIIARPATDSLFLAQHQGGAYKLEDGRWQKLAVSDISDLAKCRAVGSRFHLSESEKEFFRRLGVSSFESRGSSLKVAEICMGMADVYLTTSDKIKHWDTCASYCLVTEAGGRMTDMKGGQILYNTKDVNHRHGLLVSNGLVHDQIIKRYSEYIL